MAPQDQQLPDFAFNLWGPGYELDPVFKTWENPTLVTAMACSSHGWKNRLEAVGTDAIPKKYAEG